MIDFQSLSLLLLLCNFKIPLSTILCHLINHTKLYLSWFYFHSIQNIQSFLFWFLLYPWSTIKNCLNSMKISIRWQNCTFPSLVIHGLKDQHFVLSKMNGCIDLCHLHWTPCTDMALSTQFWWQHFKFSEAKAGVTMVEDSVITTWSVFWLV